MLLWYTMIGMWLILLKTVSPSKFKMFVYLFDELHHSSDKKLHHYRPYSIHKMSSETHSHFSRGFVQSFKSLLTAMITWIRSLHFKKIHLGHKKLQLSKKKYCYWTPTNVSRGCYTRQLFLLLLSQFCCDKSWQIVASSVIYCYHCKK